MFCLKKAKRGLTLEEKHMKADIEIARAAYELDQFVKINEIQRVVRDCVMDGDMYEKVSRFDLLARKNAEKLDKMDNVL